MRLSRLLLICGLGLVAGAVSYGPATPAAGAQVVPPPAGDVPIPPPPPPDTTALPGDTVPRPTLDTLKPPVGRSRDPAGVSLEPRYVWEGDAILASGAYTLADLLHRVPELTIFRSGWIHSPQFAAMSGDFSRLRVFLDGIELDPIGPRDFGMTELGRIPIWQLQRVAVERAGSEVRVHLRTWTVERTTAYTRVDVYTGMEETDIYRGFFGKRFGNGGLIQAAGQQAGTQNLRLGGGGDGLSLMLRGGFGWRLLSIDGYAERTSENRLEQSGGVGGGEPLPAYAARNTNAYVRAALGSVERGPWLEFLAATRQVRETSPQRTAAPVDTVDTIVSRLQYVASAGWRGGPLSLTLTDRLRRIEGETHNTVAGRVELLTRLAEVSGYVENSRDLRVSDARLRLQPVRFFALSGSASQRRVLREGPGDTASSTTLRGEAGLNLGGVWLYGGALSVETGPLVPVSFFERVHGGGGGADALTSPFLASGDTLPDRRVGSFAGLRGIGWRGLGANTWFLRWNEPGPYVPEYQGRVEINFQTSWLSRFPRGEFDFRIAFADEFRSSVTSADGRTAPASHILWGLLEIRIQRATLTIQTRNPLGREYFIVPGYEMPRTISTYGVRWFFWN